MNKGGFIAGMETKWENLTIDSTNKLKNCMFICISEGIVGGGGKHLKATPNKFKIKRKYLNMLKNSYWNLLHSEILSYSY